MNPAYQATLQTKSEKIDAVLTVEQLQQAKKLAVQTQQPLLTVLEDISNLTPDLFVQALGQLVHYPVLTISQLYDLQPDFTVLPFTQAEKLGCIAVRDQQHTLYIVHANPFEANLPSKIDLLIAETVVWVLAHSDDLDVYLAHHETSMRALGEVNTNHGEHTNEQHGLEDISLRSISEDTSPIVKFVRSTLYDALKSGASDIHL